MAVNEKSRVLAAIEELNRWEWCATDRKSLGTESMVSNAGQTTARMWKDGNENELRDNSGDSGKGYPLGSWSP